MGTEPQDLNWEALSQLVLSASADLSQACVPV
jgi:hypothetical protein